MALKVETLGLLRQIEANAEAGDDNLRLAHRFLDEAILDGEPLHEAVASLAAAVRQGYVKRLIVEGRRYMYPPKAEVTIS